METPEGVRWLHQLVWAAHFSIPLQGGAGVRVVCQFPRELVRALVEPLIPALYLERVAARSTLAEPRHRLRTLSRQLLEPLRHGTHPLQASPPTERAHLEQVAGDCADRFQRSSSGVEGRNGQLALHHQGRHRLSDRKLAALTAVHKYHIRRADDPDRPSSPI